MTINTCSDNLKMSNAAIKTNIIFTLMITLRLLYDFKISSTVKPFETASKFKMPILNLENSTSESKTELPYKMRYPRKRSQSFAAFNKFVYKITSSLSIVRSNLKKRSKTYHLLELATITPLSTEKLSVGRPAIFQALILIGSPRLLLKLNSFEQEMSTSYKNKCVIRYQ